MVSLSLPFIVIACCVTGLFVGLEVIVRSRRRELERREWLRETLQCIQEAVILTDARGTVTAMNERATALTGWPEHEAVGQPVGAVFCLVDAQTRRPVVNPLVKALYQRRPIGPSDDALLLARNNIVWEIRDRAAPLLDDRGRTFGGALAFKDVPAARVPTPLYLVR